MARVIGVFSGKGGVGKTTTTVNLGAALSYNFDKNVAVVDTNTSSSCLSLHLGMHFSPLTINSVLKGEAEVDEAIEIHGSRMKVMPASLRLTDSFVDHSRLPSIVERISKTSEIVLLDTAPSIGPETLWSLKCCNEAIIVTNPDLPAVIEALKMIKLAREYNVHILGLVINKHNKNAALSLSEIYKICNVPIISLVPDDRNVMKSIESRVPVTHYKPYSPSAVAFKKLAADIINEDYSMGILESIRSKLKI
jgi:septum site-determining protein MinD